MFSFDALRGFPGVISFQLVGHCERAHLIFFLVSNVQGKALQTTCVYIKYNNILMACNPVYIKQWWYYIALIVRHMMLNNIFSNHGYIILCLSVCYVTNDTIYHVVPLVQYVAVFWWSNRLFVIYFSDILLIILFSHVTTYIIVFAYILYMNKGCTIYYLVIINGLSIYS